MKPFNFFRPDLDLPVYKALCCVVFKLGYKDPLAKSLLAEHGYWCEEDQLKHLEQLLNYNAMQDVYQLDYSLGNVKGL